MVNIRMDDKLKKAMDRLAEKQHTSFSALTRQAMIKYLKDHGINWQDDDD